MRVSIIIPVYNAFDSAAKCLDSVYAARVSLEFEVIVVDNGSGEPFDEYLGSVRVRRDNLRVIHFEKPLGFARAVNEGARRARHEFLVLLNSDTVVTDWWLDRLIEPMSEDPSIAISGPLTNHCGQDAQVDASLCGSQPPSLDARSQEHSKFIPEPQTVSFFCAMIRRTAWEQLGGVDEIYQAGSFEDDDFCLRARLAGYRLVVVTNAFVFHEGGRTFATNRVNLGELFARNQRIFHERVSRWSRSRLPTIGGTFPAHSLSVIVPVLESAVSSLTDSLASLENQTASGFETILVHSSDICVSAWTAREYSRFRLTSKAVPGAGRGVSALLNAGLEAAQGSRIAYLIPGNIFYPYHLETLYRALDEQSETAVYSAWSVQCFAGDKERRGATTFDQAEPVRLPWGDWAPLTSWMHERTAVPQGGFDESLRWFSGWDFAIRIGRHARVRYLRRITAEVRLGTGPGGYGPDAAVEAERILGTAEHVWQRHHRAEFLEAVRKGPWQMALVIERNEIQRRARQLVGGAGLKRFQQAQTEAAFNRIERAREPVARADRSERPKVFLYSILEWSGLTQRPHHFARGLAARGYQTVWVDAGLQPARIVDPGRLSSEIEPGLHYVQLPGDGAEAIYQMEWTPPAIELMALVLERVNTSLPAKSAVQLVTFPKWAPLAAKLQDRLGWPIVYDCLDDQQSFAELFGHDATRFEDELVRRSGAVISAARVVHERHSQGHSKAALIPNAADYELFANAKAGHLLGDLRRPVIGFFGTFSDWLDLDWVAEAASRFPEWSFVYIGTANYATDQGRQRWKAVTSARNIRVIPQVDLRTLAGYLAEFDVCTMPFRDQPITRAMNPVKIYEYLAAGKAVVARDLPETRPFAELGLIRVYGGADESFRLMREAVAGLESDLMVPVRKSFAAANTWSHRVDRLIEELELLIG